jgi:murein DD-endopeptidase MepM/ murein hydrolase activator NlpD
MKLTYPVNEPIITQKFGANPQFYSDPKYGGLTAHNGIDFEIYHGQPVYASHDGLASFQVDGGGGHGVVIIGEQDGIKFKTIYWHLVDGLKEPKLASPFQDKTGFTKVSNGDLIGYADNTGASTGDHLHFGMKYVAQGEDWGTWYNLNQKNGYNGAINPEPFFDESTPVKIQIMEKQISLLKQVVEYLKLLIRG